MKRIITYSTLALTLFSIHMPVAMASEQKSNEDKTPKYTACQLLPLDKCSKNLIEKATSMMVPDERDEWINPQVGLESKKLNLVRDNTLKRDDFANPEYLQFHKIIGQTLTLSGSFGEVQKKTTTLKDLQEEERSLFPGYLFTPPKGKCHGGAVVLIPATSNIDEDLIAHAKWLTEHGFVSFVIDSYSGSNLGKSLETPFGSYMQNEIITAFRAYQILCSHPYVTGSIGIGGFSRGATVADLASRYEFYIRHSHDGKPFAFEYGYYPTIFLQQKILAVSPGPKLYLTGDQDPFVDVNNTQAYINRLKKYGVAAELKVYEGATHAFDAKAEEKDLYFPIISNANLNIFYDEHGCEDRGDDVIARISGENLPIYLNAKLSYGYNQISNPTAKTQSETDLLEFFSNKVEIKGLY